MSLRPARSISASLIMLFLLCLLLSIDSYHFVAATKAPVATLLRRQYGKPTNVGVRERISLNEGWRFRRWVTNPDNIVYDRRGDTPAQARVLKPWILPCANGFIKDPAKRYSNPQGAAPSSNISFIATTFDDSTWELLNLPHDWAIKGPFYTSENPVVGGGMGRLPVQGVGWYRRKLAMSADDEGKSIYLDVDGAMSHAMVWLNGQLVGGWPFGYNSFRLDLTTFLRPGNENMLAIRLDNPVDSSRWYNGGGIYRNVWLVKADATHVAQWGTHISTREVSDRSAIIDLTVQIENNGNISRQIQVNTDIHVFDPSTGRPGEKIAAFPPAALSAPGGQRPTLNSTIMMKNPRLWGPLPTQHPNLYVAVTHVVADNATIDTYETRFGIRNFTFSGDQGLLVNGERIRLQGVNQHHDLGALGAAFNYRAAERQLEILHELGSNAIRMSHNPPAPELLDLADQMGFLVMDEAFDCWKAQKTPNDFHLIFDEWSEADLRSMLRRDRNHPSIFAWSIGNEVGEQTTSAPGAAIARRLASIVHEEDPTRPSTASMNVAKPDQPFPVELDLISLNYQGEGIRDTGAYASFPGTRTPPIYPDFHAKFPLKLLLSSETAAALSTRGTYFFPVAPEFSAPQTDNSGGGGDPQKRQVSAYELYTAPFGASPDKVFAAQDRNQPYVAGEFVWSGWDYLGEPTPYYSARSSYFGIIDLCGFKKDRFYLYQARWRPGLKTAHLLPHWNWPNRVGQVTPVHVFSAADEAELFLNGVSQGTIKKANASTLRFRWDEVKYAPGELHVVTFKDGKEWANNTVRTTGAAAQLRLTADRTIIKSDGYDLSFVSAEVLDSKGDFVAQANNAITFAVSGPGEILATDNGDPYDMISFPSKERRVFSGRALAIVRAKARSSGAFSVTATATGLTVANITVTVQ